MRKIFQLYNILFLYSAINIYPQRLLGIKEIRIFITEL